ncbi:hypothetical protein B0A50_02228 [Salinomyces thailandicus]|uniref:DUF6697 domain-containing protein n=1 Tax=Salinomyces thailandicus TaxID=706561 RepID=A0A4U0U9N2_9PEZI|nr:hypothetical protein B0A50_02228 [Salinomyces thailandica]
MAHFNGTDALQVSKLDSKASQECQPNQQQHLDPRTPRFIPSGLEMQKLGARDFQDPGVGNLHLYVHRQQVRHTAEIEELEAATKRNEDGITETREIIKSDMLHLHEQLLSQQAQIAQLLSGSHEPANASMVMSTAAGPMPTRLTPAGVDEFCQPHVLLDRFSAKAVAALYDEQIATAGATTDRLRRYAALAKLLAADSMPKTPERETYVEDALSELNEIDGCVHLSDDSSILSWDNKDAPADEGTPDTSFTIAKAGDGKPANSEMVTEAERAAEAAPGDQGSTPESTTTGVEVGDAKQVISPDGSVETGLEAEAAPAKQEKTPDATNTSAEANNDEAATTPNMANELETPTHSQSADSEEAAAAATSDKITEQELETTVRAKAAVDEQASAAMTEFTDQGPESQEAAAAPAQYVLKEPQANETNDVSWTPFHVRNMPAGPKISVVDNTETFSWKLLTRSLKGDNWSPGFYFVRSRTKFGLKSYWIIDACHDTFLPSVPGEHGAKMTPFFNDTLCSEGYAPNETNYLNVPVFISHDPANVVNGRKYKYFGNYSQLRFSDKIGYDVQAEHVPKQVKKYWAEQLSKSGGSRPEWIIKALKNQFWPRPIYERQPIEGEHAMSLPELAAAEAGGLREYAKKLKEWEWQAEKAAEDLTEEFVLQSFEASDDDLHPALRLSWEYMQFVGYDQDLYDTLARKKQVRRERRALRETQAAEPEKKEKKTPVPNPEEVAAAEEAERLRRSTWEPEPMNFLKPKPQDPAATAAAEARVVEILTEAAKINAAAKNSQFTKKAPVPAKAKKAPTPTKAAETIAAQPSAAVTSAVSGKTDADPALEEAKKFAQGATKAVDRRGGRGERAKVLPPHLKRVEEGKALPPHLRKRA